MNSDFKDLLRMLGDCEVRYLVAGGYAVIHHSQPRYTKDIDIWLDPTPENARKLMRAFRIFGIPMVGVTQEDFATPGTQFSLGVPPSEIDFLTTIPALNLPRPGKTKSFPKKAISPFTTSGNPTSSTPSRPQAGSKTSPTSRSSVVLATTDAEG